MERRKTRVVKPTAKNAAVKTAAVRRKAPVGKKIENPLVREKLMAPIPPNAHPQERLMGSILRSLPRDILKSYSFPYYREQLRKDMCHRAQLPALAPLKAFYSSMESYNRFHATMVLEEVRCIISEGLYKRWGKDKTPLEEAGAEFDLVNTIKLANSCSEHKVYFFHARKPIRRELKSKLRAGTVVEIMAVGKNSIEQMVLGCIVRCSKKNYYLDDDDDDQDNDDDVVSIMVYNVSGENFHVGVRLFVLASALNFVRQFDACTNGRNSLNDEILGGKQTAKETKCLNLKEYDETFREENSTNNTLNEYDEENERDGESCVKEEIIEKSDEALDGIQIKTENFESDIIIKEEMYDDSNLSIHKSHQYSDVKNRMGNEACTDKVNEEISRLDDLEEKLLRESVYHVPPLNQTQIKAAKEFLNSNKRINIVQGPPGTGKTTLLVSIVCRYLLKANDESREPRIMICAPTNKAVAVLAARIADAVRDNTKISTVLIGDEERLLEDHRSTLGRFFVYRWKDEQIRIWQRFRNSCKPGGIRDKIAFRDCVLKQVQYTRRQIKDLIDDDFQSRITQLTNNLQEFIETNRHPASLENTFINFISELRRLDESLVIETLLKQANIIFCTLSSAGSHFMKETLPVDDVIVDEAAAATAPELCIALWLLTNRLLLVGDPNQLPATVASEYGKKHGLDKSLQDRLMNQCNFPYTMLDIQYRMQEQISEFPLKTFYNSKVTNGDNVLAFSYQAEATLLDGQPYAFCHVEGVVERDALGSHYNTAECNVVINLLHELQHRSRHLGADWTNSKRIRVITFYQAQVNTLRWHAKRNGLQQVTISTVDSSQGCEADVVIISFVRGSDEKVGFLNDNRRLNVALTRAKNQLICVANVTMLEKLKSDKAKIIAKLAKDALQRKCVVYPRNKQGSRPHSRHENRKNHSINRKNAPVHQFDSSLRDRKRGGFSGGNRNKNYRPNKKSRNN